MLENENTVNQACGQDCEPMCKFCNDLADQAADMRQQDWEDAGYFDQD